VYEREGFAVTQVLPTTTGIAEFMISPFPFEGFPLLPENSRVEQIFPGFRTLRQELTLLLGCTRTAEKRRPRSSNSGCGGELLLDQPNQSLYRSIPCVNISHSGTKPRKFAVVKPYRQKVRTDFGECPCLCTEVFSARVNPAFLA
jgi:hypothetical protein